MQSGHCKASSCSAQSCYEVCGGRRGAGLEARKHSLAAPRQAEVPTAGEGRSLGSQGLQTPPTPIPPGRREPPSAAKLHPASPPLVLLGCALGSGNGKAPRPLDSVLGMVTWTAGSCRFFLTYQSHVADHAKPRAGGAAGKAHAGDAHPRSHSDTRSLACTPYIIYWCP